MLLAGGEKQIGCEKRVFQIFQEFPEASITNKAQTKCFISKVTFFDSKKETMGPNVYEKIEFCIQLYFSKRILTVYVCTSRVQSKTKQDTILRTK